MKGVMSQKYIKQKIHMQILNKSKYNMSLLDIIKTRTYMINDMQEIIQSSVNIF